MHILFSGCNDELPSREIHYIAGPWALIITSTAHEWDLIIMSWRRFIDVYHELTLCLKQYFLMLLILKDLHSPIYDNKIMLS